jgi:RNA polymerase sigma factor (sigma-70 family)
MDLGLAKPENTYEQNEKAKAISLNENNAIQQLYIDVYPKAKTFILQNNGNEDQAKDIFQEAFLSLWKNIKESKFSPGQDDNIEAYLFTIAKNKWIDYLRSFHYRNKISIHEVEEKIIDSDERYGEAEEELNRNKTSYAHEAVSRLGESCKRLLKMFYFERKSMEMIAKRLKISTSTARNKKYRCMQQLREYVKEYQSDEQQ